MENRKFTAYFVLVGYKILCILHLSDYNFFVRQCTFLVKLLTSKSLGILQYSEIVSPAHVTFKITKASFPFSLLKKKKEKGKKGGYFYSTKNYNTIFLYNFYIYQSNNFTLLIILVNDLK